eukprot:GFUD01095787.1.p1 GENE.GFUD01095787.1~~GFUD01095787.1.p1  ORF type:complete len:110 (-),score=19.75 GFUD01095787.1:197-526(-)
MTHSSSMVHEEGSDRTFYRMKTVPIIVEHERCKSAKLHSDYLAKTEIPANLSNMTGTPIPGGYIHQRYPESYRGTSSTYKAPTSGTLFSYASPTKHSLTRQPFYSPDYQ